MGDPSLSSSCLGGGSPHYRAPDAHRQQPAAEKTDASDRTPKQTNDTAHNIYPHATHRQSGTPETKAQKQTSRTATQTPASTTRRQRHRAEARPTSEQPAGPIMHTSCDRNAPYPERKTRTRPAQRDPRDAQAPCLAPAATERADDGPQQRQQQGAPTRHPHTGQQRGPPARTSRAESTTTRAT